MLLHQAFAVSLTQNNLALGVIAWLILSIGVSRSLTIKNQATTSVRRQNAAAGQALFAPCWCAGTRLPEQAAESSDLIIGRDDHATSDVSFRACVHTVRWANALAR